MTTYTKSGTTVAGVVSTVTFTAWTQTIEVINRGTVDIWFRPDGVDPVVAGDNSIYLGANSYITISNPKLRPDPVSGTTSNTEVRLITNAPCAYTVEVGA